MYDYKDLRELLTKVSAVTVIDLLDKTPMIDEFAQHMVPLPEGLYSKTTHQMVFSHKSSEYFTLGLDGIKTKLVTPKDFQKCTGIIINEATGFVQKPDLKTLTIRKNLVETPIVDYRRMDVVEKCIDDYLYRLCPHTKTTLNSYPLDRLLSNKVNGDERQALLDKLQVMLMSVIDEVSAFVGSDSWHFYFTERKGSSLIISKTVDFRIYDWYRMKWSAEEPDSDAASMADIFSVFAP